MQRMELHFQGVKLPKLGSIQDRIYRQYMDKQVQREVTKDRLTMLSTLTSPQISDQNKWSLWKKDIGGIWNQYLGLSFHMEIPTEEDQDKKLLEFYEKVVKPASIKMHKDRKTGKLSLLGAEALFGSAVQT